MVCSPSTAMPNGGRMSDEPYTPSRNEVRNVWAMFCNYGGLADTGHFLMTDEAYEAFDRFIAREQANTWAEGAHRVHARNLDEAEWTADDWLSENPYRKDTA